MSAPHIDPDLLTIDDFGEVDLPHVAWSGGPAHIECVAIALKRVASGEVEYLAVRTREGEIVGMGGIDYAHHPGKGAMWQVAAKYKGQGIGTRLIRAMEERMRARGVPTATLGVEDDNPRARRLYERLGYEVTGSEEASWESVDANGKRFTYRTTCAVLSKQL